MHSSLIILLAALGFVVFGYLSMIRLLSKQSFKPDEHDKDSSGGVDINFLNNVAINLGSSAFFVSLPATSLLVFWGWGPALLWLVIFHLFIESLCHLQYSSLSSDSSISDYLLRAENAKQALIEQGLVQAFFLLSMAVVTALLATLIDRQSGLLFALLFLLPARTLLRHPSSALPLLARIFGPLALLALGLAFSNQLGFSIYGDWAPLGETVSWLRFNNPTVIAAVLTAAVFSLEKNTGFKNDLSAFSGLIIILLVIAMGVQLAWSQPELDAPMNGAHAISADLPPFMSLSLFVFAGFAALLIRLLNEEEHQTQSGIQQFNRLQSGSLVHLIFMLLLGLSLASAMGIGAWKTHYLQWNDSINILDHLNLAISSTLHLIDAQSKSGTLIHTILLASLCFAGFSFMLNCAVQLTVEKREGATFSSLILESKILQAILIFVSASYFISNGISLNVWLIIGLLGWVLITHLILGMTLNNTSSGIPGLAFSIVSVGLMTLGSIQALLMTINWFYSSDTVYALCGSTLIVITLFLWWRSVPLLIQRFIKGFDNNSNADLF